MKFENGNRMYDYLCSGRDLYNKNLGIYVFVYNDAHALCYYKLIPKEVAELIKKSEKTGEYWGGHLGLGGNILENSDYNDSTHRYSTDENMRTLYLKPSYDFCNETYTAEDWMDTDEVTIEYVMEERM